MTNIVITGGLGYIGTELCKLYSGEARFKKITVVDSNFKSEKVKQLRDWGIDFIQLSINDELIGEVIKDADIIYHLAGITDVAYTKTESNSEKDNEIKKTGVDGTRNIIKFSKKNCKIIFPSTHVIYEGLTETTTDITEEQTPCPVLTYSTGKYQSELDLISSEKNYIILRLGSVYGYSTDSMRTNIMPNLFSKISSMNGTIKLFSGGVQLKSLVPLIDTARCFKFMGDGNFSNQIFNLSKDNVTVKEVANLCKKINPNLQIVETNDEIPNLGYTISNKKLLSTGFSFLYNLEDSLKEMIENWSKRKVLPDLEYIITGSKEFIDTRGKISNYELPEPINLIGLIESKKGSVRANHYHPIQEQKCLLVKGKYISVIKDLSDDKSLIETRLIKEGDVAVIKPNVAHAMVFLEDSIFLNLVRGEREHENYGITHTIPYILVDDDFRNDLINGFKKECRVCNGQDMKKVISFGKSPLANNLLNNENDFSKKYPLELEYCSNCNNVQLNYVVPSGEMFDDYLYLSSTSKDFVNHFELAAEKYINRFKLNENSTVVDIGSNDGIGLKPFIKHNINVIGIEPAKNVAEIAEKSGIPTINLYFNKNIFNRRKFADLVTASNVFAHSDFLKEITLDVFEILKEDGVFIIEVQYVLDTIRDLTFDNIYHEHVNYWSVLSLKYFFENLNLKVIDVEHIDTHGGSIRVYVKSNGIPTENVENFIKEEISFGLNKFETYKIFSKNVYKIKQKINEKIEHFKNNGFEIIGYGSPAKATTALNFFGLTNNDILYIVEDNVLKHNKIMPGTNIPIVSKDNLKEGKYKILILAWNFADYIKNNNKNLIEKGVEFISIKEITK